MPPQDIDIERLRDEARTLRERAVRAEEESQHSKEEIRRAEREWRTDIGQKVVNLEKSIQAFMSNSVQRVEFEKLREQTNSINLRIAGWSGGLAVISFLIIHFWK